MDVIKLETRKKIPPDGGYGWIIVIAYSLFQVCYKCSIILLWYIIIECLFLYFFKCLVYLQLIGVKRKFRILKIRLTMIKYRSLNLSGRFEDTSFDFLYFKNK